MGKSSHDNTATRQNVLFADVNCDGYDDYLVVDKVGGVTAYYNTKAFPNWGTPNKIAYGVGTNMHSIRFADVNGDGCADYLMVEPNGKVTAYLNLGASHFPQWAPPVVIAYGVGAPREYIRFADINGDGLADYLVIDPVNGSTHAWISKGPNASAPWTWNDVGVIAYGIGVGGHSVIFADVNGDKLADYLEINESNAAVTAYLNPCQAPSTGGSGGSGPTSGGSGPTSSSSGSTSGGSGPTTLSPPTATSTKNIITAAPGPTPTCTHYNEDPDQSVFIDYCVCSGSTFPAPSSITTVTPVNLCPYSTMPTRTFNPKSPPQVVTANCQVYTLVQVDLAICTTQSGCTPTAVPSVIADPKTCVLAGGYGNSLYINFGGLDQDGSSTANGGSGVWLALGFKGGAGLYSDNSYNTIALAGSCTIAARDSLLESDVVFNEVFGPLDGYASCNIVYKGVMYNGKPSETT